jgi:hypothetical protein
LPMYRRLIALLAIVCEALLGGGCAHNRNNGYEEVLMPLQTGSVLHRRVLVKGQSEKKTKKKKKKEATAPKPEAEPSATPTPEEESTPPPDRFR